MGCTECDMGIDHCHGTLVVHDDATVTCWSDGACDLVRARHALRVVCTDDGCACGDVTPAWAASSRAAA